MKLHALTLHNFGPVAHDTLVFDSLSHLISGENGAGKTSILDGLNTAITLGGQKSQYNAAGDSTKKADGVERTLAAYCLGAQTMGLARPRRTRSYGVATYAPDASDAFAGFLHVGFLCEAAPNEKSVPTPLHDPLGFCMISDSPDFPFSLFAAHPAPQGGAHRHTFANEFKANVKASPHERDLLISDVKSQHAKNAHQLAFQCDATDTARAIERLTAPMSTLSMKHAISSPNEFAAKAIESEFDASGIYKLRQAAIEHRNSERLMASLNALADSSLDVQDRSTDFASHCLAAACAQTRIAETESEKAQAFLDGLLRNSEDLVASREKHAAKCDSLQTQIQEQEHIVERARSAELAAASGDPLAGERAALGALESDAARAHAASNQAALAWSSEKSAISKASSLIGDYAPAAGRAIDASLADPSADPLLAIDAHRSFLADASAQEGSLRREISLVYQAKSVEDSRLAELSARLELNPHSAASHIPATVAEALDHLNAVLPEARARSLCSAVEALASADPDWIAAIELHIGASRFAIVVNAGWEYKAVGALKSNPSRARGPAPEIARNDKNQKNIRPLPPGSILSLLRCSDPEAMAFLTARFGSTVMCPDEASYKAAERGLTLDGRSSNAQSLRSGAARRDDHPLLVFGAAARAASRDKEAALAAKLQASSREKQMQAASLEATLQACRDLLALSPEHSKWRAASEASAYLVRAKKLAHEARERIARADALANTEGNAALLEQERSNEREATRRKNELAQSHRESSILAARIQGQLDKILENIEDAQTDRLTSTEKHESAARLAHEWASVCGSSAEASFAPMRALDRLGAENRLKDIQAHCSRAASRWKASCDAHNASDSVDEPGQALFDEALVAAPTPASCKIAIDQARAAAAHCASRKNTQLQDTMAQAEQNCDKIFASVFCHNVLNADAHAERSVKNLNGIFGAIAFKGVVFEIERTRHAEYQSQLESMRRIVAQAHANPGSRIDWEKVQPSDRALFDRFKDLASVDTADSREQIAALCNPIRKSEFDIHAHGDRIQPDGTASRALLYSLSTEHTKSGGERESAYILLQSLIAASKAGILSGKNGSAPRGFRILQMDEAFDKLSTHFVDDLIDFFETVLDVQLLALTPALKAPSLSPCFPLLTTVVPTGRTGKPFTVQLTTQKTDRDQFKQLRQQQDIDDIDSALDETLDGLDIAELSGFAPDISPDMSGHELALILEIQRLEAGHP